MVAALGFLLAVSPLSAIPAAAADTPGVTAPAPADASADVAQSSDASDSFADVPTTHWAYQAVEELADDGYIKGYPDGTFKGNRPLTRYEMAALTERALSAIKSSIVAGQDVNQRDITDLKKLMTAFAGQLKDVQGQLATVKSQQAATQQQVTTLQQQQAALKAEADATRAGLAQNRGGLNFDYKPATSFLDAEVTNGPYAKAVGAAGTFSPAVLANAPLPAYYGATPGLNIGTNYTFGGGGAGGNAIAVGPHAQGITEFGVKPYLQGTFPDGHFSYQVRLAYIDQAAMPNGLSSSTPIYCTSQGLPAAYPCVYQDSKSNNAQIPITLDRYYIQWSSIPGNQGFGALVGKISATGNTGSRNVNPTIGYGKKVGGGLFYMDPSPNQWLEAAVAVGQTTGVSSEELAQTNAQSAVCTSVLGLNTGTITNTNPGFNGFCNGNALEVYGYVQLFDKATGTAVGINSDTVNSYPFTYWNAAALRPTQRSAAPG
jgi:hypothetical protein